MTTPSARGGDDRCGRNRNRMRDAVVFAITSIKERTMQFFRPVMLVLGAAAGLAAGGWPSCAHSANDPAAALGLPAGAAAALRGIDAEHIRAHVRFLADDLLEGRGTGARGGDIAARYIAAQFALDGLRPAGDDGSYLQRVAFTGVQTLDGTSASLAPANGAPLALQRGADYV